MGELVSHQRAGNRFFHWDWDGASGYGEDQSTAQGPLWSMIDVTSFPSILQLHPVDGHLYEGAPEHGTTAGTSSSGPPQMIVAAHLDRNVDHVDDKEVKSIHATSPAPVTTPSRSSTSSNACTTGARSAVTP